MTDDDGIQLVIYYHKTKQTSILQLYSIIYVDSVLQFNSCWYFKRKLEAQPDSYTTKALQWFTCLIGSL